MKVFGIIVLCFVLSSHARPRLLREKTGSNLHFTNIGDIASKDILRLADSTAPDSDLLNPEQTDDPYENNIEAETLEYSKTKPLSDSPVLVTPRDQEQRFVELLKKQYKGTFPEYGKETKSDFSKNKELEDNLSVQPETVYFGHSDIYKGKHDDFNDYPVPDDSPVEQDNLSTFDEDANILNNEGVKLFSTTINPHHHSKFFDNDHFQDTTMGPSHAKHHTSETIEDVLGEYGDNTADDGQSGIENLVPTEDNEEHKSVSENNHGYMDLTKKLRKKHERVNYRVTDHMTDSMDDHVMGNMDNHVTDNAADEMEDDMSMVNPLNDDIDDHVSDDMAGSMDGHSSDEVKKLKEKTAEEALWDSGEKLRQQLARQKKHKNMTQPKESLKKEQHSETILKDFDELKKHNSKTSDKLNGNIEKNGKAKPQNLKQASTNKEGKHIQYVHADESQGTGDAILDFLDKLLEKDPKQLKHDVLAMTKEMQTEGDSSYGAPGKGITTDKTTTNPDSPTILKDKPHKVNTEHSKEIKKPDELDNWISQWENSIDDSKLKRPKDKEMKEQNDRKNEDYYDEEYDQFHDETQDIYPDHNGGQSVKQEENNKKEKDQSNEHINEKHNDFDYEEFKEEALKMHNEYRRRHNAVALSWSDSLAKKAEILASKLLDATRSNFKRELEKQGENIAILPYSTKNIAKHAVEKWYGEITKFSFTSPSIKPETRDFTQIIWKNTKEVGMGFVHTPDKKKTLVIALYSPSGNDEHKLQENLNTVHDDPYADIKRNSILKSFLKDQGTTPEPIEVF